MVGFIAGIVLMWVGHISPEHAIALLTGAIWVLVLSGRYLWRDL